jgi:hypothetical protein
MGVMVVRITEILVPTVIIHLLWVKWLSAEGVVKERERLCED